VYVKRVFQILQTATVGSLLSYANNKITN